MRRFVFRLQRILDIREQICDEARQELVRRNQARDQEARVLAELEGEYLRAMIRDGGTYSASELVMFGDYRASLKQRIAQQKERLIAAQKAVDEAKERYVEASRDVKALEKLREKRQLEHTELALREEGAALDEFAIQRTPRGN